MNINGSYIFMGAYEERNQKKYQFNHELTDFSEEKKLQGKEYIENELKAMDRHPKEGVVVSISKEDMDFLCSEEGFEKIKKDAADLYIKNAEAQKKIAANRDPSDPFWYNTGNQWLIFSESLYKSGYYDKMEDTQVKELESMLGKITSGMDFVSKTQYKTGLDFSHYGKENKSFMSSAEAAMELESSTNALKYFADKYVPAEQREEFNKLIDSYSAHNKQVLGEYRNPEEGFYKAVHDINTGYYPNSCVSGGGAPQKSDEFKYAMQLGGINKSTNDKQEFQSQVSKIFEEMLIKDSDQNKLFKRLERIYLGYVTDDSQDQKFLDYMRNQSKSVFDRMKEYWSDLL